LDAATKNVLDKGVRNVEILKQGQFSPVPVEKQVAIIYIGVKGLMSNVPVDKVRDFEAEFLQQLEVRNPEVLRDLKQGQFNDDLTGILEKVAKELTAKY